MYSCTLIEDIINSETADSIYSVFEAIKNKISIKQSSIGLNIESKTLFLNVRKFRFCISSDFA